MSIVPGIRRLSALWEMSLAIDVDARGEIIGIELVGIQQLTISQIRRKLPDRLKKIDFENARWVPAAVAA